MPRPHIMPAGRSNFFAAKRPKKRKPQKVLWFPCECKLPHKKITSLRMHSVTFPLIVKHGKKKIICVIVKQEKLARNCYGWRWRFTLKGEKLPDNYKIIVIYNPTNGSAVNKPIHRELFGRL